MASQVVPYVGVQQAIEIAEQLVKSELPYLMKTRAGVKNKVVRSWEPAKKFEDGFHVYFTMPVCSVVVSLKGVPGLFLNEATHPLVNGRK